MSFNQAAFASVGAHSSNTPKIYSYQSNDTLAQVTADNYFIDKRFQLSDGDWIFAVLSDDRVFLQVQADSSTALNNVGGVFAETVKVINSKSQLPSPSGGVIVLDGNINYELGKDLSLGTDELDVSAGNISWTSKNLAGPKLTYTGSGTMFTGVDAQFTAKDARFGCPNGQAFDFSDVASPGSSIILLDTIQIDDCGTFGVFDDLLSIVIADSNSLNCDQGALLKGTNWLIQSFIKFALVSTQATFKGIDFGTAETPNVEIANLFFAGPSGAIGVTGATNSANIATDGIGTFRDSNFVGDITETTNITPDDIRWAFDLNSGLADTMPDAMVSLQGNAVETVIASAGVAVQIPGTWVVERQSLFIALTDGSIQYKGERPLTTPIDFVTTEKSASGTNKDTTTYVALNGSIITNSGRSNEVGQNNPQPNAGIWQLTLVKDDILTLWHANNTDTVNLVVVDGISRVR
ncbi:MAG: hypothetical protein COB84_01940 [Rhodobacteraceae bacterium]|nr:MAG: hypothetical protein COB84_01940 [Paracoccaceae bacterium]